MPRKSEPRLYSSASLRNPSVVLTLEARLDAFRLVEPLEAARGRAQLLVEAHAVRVVAQQPAALVAPGEPFGQLITEALQQRSLATLPAVLLPSPPEASPARSMAARAAAQPPSSAPERPSTTSNHSFAPPASDTSTCAPPRRCYCPSPPCFFFILRIWTRMSSLACGDRAVQS